MMMLPSHRQQQQPSFDSFDQVRHRRRRRRRHVMKNIVYRGVTLVLVIVGTMTTLTNVINRVSTRHRQQDRQGRRLHYNKKATSPKSPSTKPQSRTPVGSTRKGSSNVVAHHKHKDSSSPIPRRVAQNNNAHAKGAATGRQQNQQSQQQTAQGNNNQQQHQQQQRSSASALDFVISGFPKCGTTTLLYALRAHDGAAIADKERCAIANVRLPPGEARQTLDRVVHELSSLSDTKPTTARPHDAPIIRRGIKCPSILYSYQTISRIEEYTSSGQPQNQQRQPVKFVIGLRHPIELLQSFYNYRVTEVYDHRSKDNSKKKKKKKPMEDHIPSFDDLMRVPGKGKGLSSWKGVSREITRFELFLMQFGKTKMTLNDLSELAKRPNMGVKPSSNTQVFLYTLDQMNDHDDENRSLEFRKSLSSFLGLTQTLDPLGHENRNHFVGPKAHPETIDICQPKYKKLRRDLVKQGKKTAQWILEDFLKSPDVAVGNHEHFVATVQSWGKDPCATASASTATTQLGSVRVLSSHRHRHRKRQIRQRQS